ncbi:olfactory receptor 14C36-like [Falco naumanni]|uniref:olfactory receptor 14C36-like n=1 Tax=Falco naumanni TaxID=148594 RepID=UPI001ADDFDDE|nr:olfactory receptor 14C36-like [Falco naumanni]
MSNSSSITQFLLLALADTRELQLLHFWLSLGIYLAALMANGLIITTVVCDHHLHTPMYFFLLNLSLLDLGSISTIVPKAMANSLWDTRDISYSGCAAQLFLIVFFLSAECSLLTVMAYDRFVAICQPLHYGTLLGSRACVHMAAAAWASGFLCAALHTANTLSLPLCQGNALGQVFCEIPQILKLSCSHTYLREVGLLVAAASLLFGCFVFIVLSYVQIFRAVLRIPSEQGRHKAFSTCLPHLAVVSLFVSTGTFAYLKPPSISSPSLDLVVSVLYSVVPPALNPLIYSMRNQELKGAMKALQRGLHRDFKKSLFCFLTDCFESLLMDVRSLGCRVRVPTCTSKVLYGQHGHSGIAVTHIGEEECLKPPPPMVHRPRIKGVFLWRVTCGKNLQGVGGFQVLQRYCRRRPPTEDHGPAPTGTNGLHRRILSDLNRGSSMAIGRRMALRQNDRSCDLSPTAGSYSRSAGVRTVPDIHLNIVTDSMFVAKLCLAMSGPGVSTSTTALMLEEALFSRKGTISVIHVNSHNPIKGFFQIGNDKADAAAKGLWTLRDARQ